MSIEEHLAVPPPVFSLNTSGSDLLAEAVAEKQHREFTHSANTRYPANLDIGDEVRETLLASEQFSGRIIYIAETPDKAIVRVDLNSGFADATAYGRSTQHLVDALAWIKEVQPEVDAPDDAVRVTFWSYGPHGPLQATRTLEAAEWDDVAANYGPETRLRLEGLMSSEFEPAHGGQLLLWSGEAGTGKTNALRALAREWKDWCRIHYIVDPEKFFGANADYLTQVLMGGEDDAKEFFATKGFESDARPQWRLLVLEDSGELMRADAAEVTGKALSRLLNTVDGLIGQGLRIMVLVTTNEEVGKLHPAISRPGRCASEIKFDKLTSADAEAWREMHELPPSAEAATLAELYAELLGFEGAHSKQPVGFATT